MEVVSVKTHGPGGMAQFQSLPTAEPEQEVEMDEVAIDGDDGGLFTTGKTDVELESVGGMSDLADVEDGAEALDKGAGGNGSGCSMGLFMIFCSGVSFQLMSYIIKYVKHIPSFELLWWRSVVVTIIADAWLWYRKEPIWGDPTLRVGLFLCGRAFWGTLALSCFYYSLHALPLADAITLVYFNVVITPLLAFVVLREKLGVMDLSGMAIACIGVTMVARPSFIFGNVKDGESLDGFAVLIALSGAFFSAAAFVTIRCMKESASWLVLVHYFHVLSFPYGVAMMFWLQEFVVPSAFDVLLLIVIGVTAFGGQALLNRGLQIEKAGRVTTVNTVQIVFSFIVGWMFFGEEPSIIGASGACLILASMLLLAVKKK